MRETDSVGRWPMTRGPHMSAIEEREGENSRPPGRLLGRARLIRAHGGSGCWDGLLLPGRFAPLFFFSSVFLFHF